MNRQPPPTLVQRPPRSPSRFGIVLACAAIALGLALAVVIVAVAVAIYLRPRAAAGPAVEYILDSSPRMAEPAANDTGTRLAVAQSVLAEIVRPADPTVTAGLRVFGSGVQTVGCQDTDLLVPLAPSSQGQISNRLLSMTSGPNPDAAMAEAMIAAIRDLAPTTGPHSLVVVTGGEDSCNPEAGQLIAAEAARAGITLQLFVVGYQVPDDQADSIKGLVDDAGAGTYINTSSKAELTRVLGAIQDYVDAPGSLSPADIVGTATAVAPTPTVAPPAATETPAPPTETPAAPGTLTLLDAAQLVLDQIVLPASLDHDAIVFAWPHLLIPGDLIQPYPFPGPTPPPIPTPIGVESWFFWVDDVPAGKYAHPSRFVVVEAATGAVYAGQYAFWPVLNGQGLWITSEDYWDPANWVFSSLTWAPAPAAAQIAPAFRGLAAPAQRPPPQGAGTVALVINGWQTDHAGLTEFAADAAQMSSALAQGGAAVTYLGPPQDANAERDGDATRDNIAAHLNKMSASLGQGDDVVIYLTGHILAGPEGGAIIAGLNQVDLASLLSQFRPEVKVSVILDGSFSGAFLESLKPVADLIITSTDAQTASRFDIDPGGDPNLNDRGSEFTSSLAAGLAQAGGGDAPTRLRTAFGIALGLDAAAINGLTLPQIWPLQAPATPVPPTPTPTETPTPTQTLTPEPVLIYRVQLTLFSDPGQQADTIKMPEFLDLVVVEGTANFSGPAPWVNVTGQPNSDGAFTALGKGTVAGIEGVSVRFEGRFVRGRLVGDYAMGTEGELPEQMPVIYEVTGSLLQSTLSTPVPTTSD